MNGLGVGFEVAVFFVSICSYTILPRIRQRGLVAIKNGVLFLEPYSGMFRDIELVGHIDPFYLHAGNISCICSTCIKARYISSHLFHPIFTCNWSHPRPEIPFARPNTLSFADKYLTITAGKIYRTTILTRQDSKGFNNCFSNRTLCLSHQCVATLRDVGNNGYGQIVPAVGDSTSSRYPPFPFSQQISSQNHIHFV